MDEELRTETPSRPDQEEAQSSDVPMRKQVKSPPFAYYRTLTGMTSPKHRPLMTKLKGVTYLVLPNDTSFYIYDLEGLRLRFYAHIKEFLRVAPGAEPNAAPECFSKFLVEGHMVILAIGNRICWSTRGENVYEMAFSGRILDMVRIGPVLVVALEQSSGKNEVVFLHNEIQPGSESAVLEQENLELQEDFCTLMFSSHEAPDSLSLPANATVTHLFHPSGYKNKLLIVAKHSAHSVCTIYNFCRRKTVFTFELSGTVADVQQSAVGDVLGFAMEDGKILIYDIKKNKEVCTLTTTAGLVNSRKIFEHVQVSFSDKMMLVVKENTLYLFDLYLKKIIATKQDVYSAACVSPTLILLSRADSIEVYELEETWDDKLRLVMRRVVVHGSISGLAKLSETELLAWSQRDVFKVSLCRDEQNSYVVRGGKSDPEEMAVKSVSVDGYLAVVNDRLLRVFGDNISRHGSREENVNSCIKKLMELRARLDWAKVHREFCLVGQNKRVSIINVNSRRVVFERVMEERVLGGDFGLQEVVLLTASGLFFFDTKRGGAVHCRHQKLCDFENNLAVSDGASVELVGSIVLVHSNSRLHMVCGDVTRTLAADSYSLDFERRYLAAVYHSDLMLYDIATCKEVERMRTSYNLVSVLIMDRLKFIVLLDDQHAVHILSNASFFTPTADKADFRAHESKPIVSSSDVVVTEKQQNLFAMRLMDEVLGQRVSVQGGDACDLAIKGMTKEEVSALLQRLREEIERGGRREFFCAIYLLRKIVLYRHAVLDSEELLQVKNRVESIWDSYQTCYLETLGVIENVRQRNGH